ncbi:YbjN domain-containing protein [Spirosoma aureum]|uniref:YbjN domain-containing protein n=1 Tax=Spirosoma aureum TaxID=2692134 RepID=A0A6G9AXB5_9BACT|nr:YbjN domain-containing protein [Spirosoma aureum]QIP16935.1 YbjN domain-containing protein [Spirosoma aureum]
MEPIKNPAPARPSDVQEAAYNEQYNRVTTMIQHYVESIGLTKESTYNPKNSNWLWKNGSATIEVFIQTIHFPNGSRRDYLRIFSPLLEIPANNLLSFYRHLLELNDLRLGVKLCIAPKTQTVYATYERDIRGMDYQELTTCIVDLELWADELDDQLKEQFPNWSN